VAPEVLLARAASLQGSGRAVRLSRRPEKLRSAVVGRQAMELFTLRKCDALEEIGNFFSLRGFECDPVTPTPEVLREKSAEHSADFLYLREEESSSPVRYFAQIDENQSLLCCIVIRRVRILSPV